MLTTKTFSWKVNGCTRNYQYIQASLAVHCLGLEGCREEVGPQIAPIRAALKKKIPKISLKHHEFSLPKFCKKFSSLESLLFKYKVTKYDKNIQCRLFFVFLCSLPHRQNICRLPDNGRGILQMCVISRCSSAGSIVFTLSSHFIIWSHFLLSEEEKKSKRVYFFLI